ncbi:MAG TPA: DMT family transporter [Gemmatimonadales bacterium]|jgi:drug/metabolite transporter (DMT)-like permease|nr:DMT family transporter [Gemmatimonadales bacterium]
MPVVLALVVVQLIYASGVIVGKFILPIVPAPVIVTLRMLVASIAFFIAHRAIRGSVPRFGSDWARFALLGVLGGAGNQLLVLLGLTRTTAINTAILIPMIPIFTVIFGWALRKDRPTLLKWSGVAIAALGTVYLIGPDRVSLASDVALGNLLVLTGMAFNALAFLLSKDLLQRFPPVTVAFCLTVTGLVGVFPLGLSAASEVQRGALNAPVVLWLAYLVVFPTTVTYFLNLWSLRRASPTLVTSFIYLQPLFTTAVAPLVLRGEQLTLRVAAAGCAIFAGVGLVLMAEKRQQSRVNSQPSTGPA